MKKFLKNLLMKTMMGVLTLILMLILLAAVGNALDQSDQRAKQREKEDPWIVSKPLSPEILEAQHASDSIREDMRTMSPERKRIRDRAMDDYLATQKAAAAATARTP